MRRLSPNVIRPNGRIVESPPASVRVFVYERDGYTCRRCGSQGQPGKTSDSIQARHIVPLREGGEHNAENLITLCCRCATERRRSSSSSRRNGRRKTTTRVALGPDL